MKEMSKIFEEICIYKNWVDCSDYESKLTLLRKKHRQLMNTIVLRNINDYKMNKSSEISDEDVEIVKKLLIMAVDGEGENKICKKWFNGKLKYNDYKDRAELFDTLDIFLKELLNSQKINNNTYDRWILTFDTLLYGYTSKQILDLYNNIDSLVKTTSGLNRNIDLSYFDIEIGEKRRKLFPPPPPEVNDDITKISLDELINYFSYQEEYFINLNNIIEFMKMKAIDKECDLIEFVIIYMIKEGKYINDKAANSNLAYEGLNFIDQLYIFLTNNDDALKRISDNLRIPKDDILRMFKFINRDKK